MTMPAQASRAEPQFPPQGEAQAPRAGQAMNGAESLVHTLVRSGVDVCFSNPGTSEMHFVAALDKVEGMRCVLCLFEGVATGAADGYGRMLDRPASTLLHLGPGLANGIANLHNASRASAPVVNIVGDHATYHRQFDAPLTSDIEMLSRQYSAWQKTSASAAAVARDGADAVGAALEYPGRIATLILPADTAWNEGGEPQAARPPAPPRAVEPAVIRRCAEVLSASGPRTALILAGRMLRERPIALASRIGARTGARVFASTAASRIERGAGRARIERLPYPIDQSLALLKGFDHVVLVGAKPPVAFFAYPGKPSELMAPGSVVHRLAEADEDGLSALEELADRLGPAEATIEPAERLPLPSGAITSQGIGAVLNHWLPEGAIVSDESLTAGRGVLPMLAGAPKHDWMFNSGGSIGMGLPLGVGAAIACPGRRVICFQADGSALYTPQALWTMAREQLDITVLLLNNRSYATLAGEFANVGAGRPGQRARDMMEIARPDIGWQQLAASMGVRARRVGDLTELSDAFAASLREPGPMLIEAML